MKIPSFVWVILVVVLGVGFMAFLANNKNAQSMADATLPVQVEVYMDFNCPHCADFEPTVKAAREKYGEKANIQLKNLPFLTSGQTPDTSVEYSYAQIAAAKQGKGNEYAEGLFKWVTFAKSPNNNVFTYSEDEKALFASSAVRVDGLAEFLGLDLTKFSQDRVSDEVKAEMRKQKEDAVKIMGAPSTPSVFFYGKLFKMTTYDDFDAKIDAYIKQAEANQNK